ncbi:nucleoside hydrolase [Chromatocurvus halotolerans]|uniref:Inosine-uridine nucleoside N-ribohydrolase n=1 Tax=Chromatocurvus halotolerans TaxID=1132028 RepID=A0A4R2KRR2_9GAMM|nr:nucleoside hydrolase [Chromatocurvus halotolerans]TCO75462.1 inosine-uridine nucleoside N-ribohydrolase [Chromatocurvus halotolerans]
MSTPARKRVIFDTDIGIDDAMALLFLHYSPDVELVAITSVAGNASIDDTTRNALHVKERFGIAAPVHRGAARASGPALGEGYPDFVHGRNGLGDLAFDEPALREDPLPAAEAIVALAMAHPGELSLVAVGRLTNIAAALALCPRLPQLLREVVVMGGVFGVDGQGGNVSPVAEANIAGDPAAADAVFVSGMPLTLVGLDVTAKTRMDESFIRQLRERAGDAGEFIYRTTRLYFDFYEQSDGSRDCPIHDSSAVACLLAPSLYRTRSRVVRVAIGGIAIGQTVAGEPGADYVSDAWREAPPLQICVDVDADAVRQLYLETLALAGKGGGR